MSKQATTVEETITRYTFDYDCQIDPQCDCSVETSKQGEYVRYEDYEKAEAKLKRLESRGFEDLHHENEQLKATIKAISELPDKWNKPKASDPAYFISDEMKIRYDCANDLQALIKEQP